MLLPLKFNVIKFISAVCIEKQDWQIFPNKFDYKQAGVIFDATGHQQQLFF